jgi:hypothetical protein
VKHPSQSFAGRACGPIGLLLLLLSGCHLMPRRPDFPLHPFASDDQNTLTIERSEASPKPQVQTQDMGPLVDFMRLHPDPEWIATARVDFILDEYGVPRLVYPIAASDPAYGRALAEAVSRWRYSPGMKAHKAVRVHLQVTLTTRGGNAPSPVYDELRPVATP